MPAPLSPREPTMTERTTPDATDLKARLPVFGYAYRYPEGEARSVIRFATGGRSINGSRPTEVIELCRLDEAADALDAKDRTIAGLREAFLETREFLSLLEPAVCDWSCPSKWRSGEPQPHSKLHHDLRDVLHKHETVAIALRDQRLARRMGAEFVPH